jgi:signal transduction histidine kinase/ActR/RegA family two-component response regulator
MGMAENMETAGKTNSAGAVGSPGRVAELGAHPVSLSFRDRETESVFQKNYFYNNLKHGRLCHLLAILFFAGDGLRDFLLFPDALLPLMTVRYGIIVPVFAAGLAVSYFRPQFYRRHWQKIFFGYVLVTGFGAIALTVLATPPLGQTLYIGVIYCLIFGYTFIRLRFLPATAAGLIVTSAYVMVATGPPGLSAAVLWVRMPYLVGINLLGMFVAYHLEFSARRGFHLNRLLARQKDRLDAANRKLSRRVGEGTQALKDANRVLLEKIDQLNTADQERRRLENQLVQTQKLESLGTLAGGIAHDFNNILTSVIGYTEMALYDLDPESEIAENLNEVMVAGNRAKELVAQILTFSRQSDTVVQPIRVAAIVEEVAKLLRSTLPAAVAIDLDFRTDLTTIMGDSTQIHQVVMNLCTNAAHAMGDGGGSLELVLDHFSCGPASCGKPVDMAPGDYLGLTVADSGAGIRPEVLPRIFDPFFTTKEQGKGTGMGLSVVHGIVQSHGGHIAVSSQPGQGTRFDLYFPLSEKSGVTDGQRLPAATPAGNGRLLLVDDDLSIIHLQRRFLERVGYRVTARTSSTEALAAFRVKQAEIDLVITDLTMPQMTGDCLVKEIRKIRPDIPVILCTGYSESISEENAREMGIDRFLMKPVGNADLAAVVSQLLAKGADAGP